MECLFGDPFIRQKQLPILRRSDLISSNKRRLKIEVQIVYLKQKLKGCTLRATNFGFFIKILILLSEGGRLKRTLQ